MPRLALAILEIAVAVTNRSFFDSLPDNLSSLTVVSLCLPGCFLASHDPVSLDFIKILWITLLDFPTVFEISPIDSLSSLRNLTICFLRSNDVIDFFWPRLQCKNLCNLVKYVGLSISFQTFFVQAFRIVVDSWKFTMLLLYILWDDWPIFRISGSNEQLQKELEYTLLKPNCHSWWISKMQSGREDTLEERYAIKLCFKLGKNATETYGMLQTAFRPSWWEVWEE